ncbi:unnamed protein product [Auanema sp. JU1783]|nr:unnamed protein product [Auanema sp. JU1783]
MDENVDWELELVKDISRKIYEEQQKKDDLIKFEPVTYLSEEQKKKVEEIKNLMKQQPSSSNQASDRSNNAFPPAQFQHNTCHPVQKHNSLSNLSSYTGQKPMQLQKQNSFTSESCPPPPLFPRLSSLPSIKLPPPPLPPRSKPRSGTITIPQSENNGSDLIGFSESVPTRCDLSLSTIIPRRDEHRSNTPTSYSELVPMKLYQPIPGPAPFNSDLYVPFSTISEEYNRELEEKPVPEPVQESEKIVMSPDFNPYFNFNMEVIESTPFEEVMRTFNKRSSISEKLFRPTDGLTDEQAYISGWSFEPDSNSVYGIASATTNYPLTKIGRNVHIRPREKYLFLDTIRIDEEIDDEVLANGAVYLKTPVGKLSTRHPLETLFYDLVECLETRAGDHSVVPRSAVSEHSIRACVENLCKYLHFYEPTETLLDTLLNSKTEKECQALAFQYLALLMIKFQIFCDSSLCNFAPCLDQYFIRSRSHQPESTLSMRDRLRVMINSVHNLPNRFHNNYSTFSVEVQLYFGTRLIERKQGTSYKTLDRNGCFPHIVFENSIDFNLSMDRTPQEIKYVFLLIGYPISQAASSSCCCLGYATIPLFKHNSFMREGQWFVELTDVRDKQMRPWGPYSYVCSPSAPILAVTFPFYEKPVMFPEVHRGTFEPREFSSLPSNEQHELLDLIEKCNIVQLMESGQRRYDFSEEASYRETLWAKRMFLTHLPEALPLVLACVPEWSYGFLHHVQDMIDVWTELNYIQAFQLLLPYFPNAYVREKACKWICSASSDSLFKVLPVLVETLRYETYDNNAVSYLLVKLGTTDLRFKEEIMWQLKCRVDHGGNYAFCNRCEVILNKLSTPSSFVQQCEIIDFLFYVQKKVSESSDQAREMILRREMSKLNEALSDEKGSVISLPLDPSFKCEGIDIANCKVLPSFNKPLKIRFLGGGCYYDVLHKMGDDIRQDAIVMQLMQIMSDIWFEDGLDLRIITYKCIPVGIRRGLIQIVRNCETLHSIQSGCKGVFKDDSVLTWIQKNNPSEYDYEIAMDNFTRSCAGWCVATYILGIGDRHNENIMVTKSGHVFHIDFGKYMGDWQKAAGIRRDRVPFVFTTEMCYVINGGAAQGERFQNFIDYCCEAFNLLRGRYIDLITILKLMACSDIPGINLDSLRFVENNLLLDISSTDATIQFTKMINESLKSAFPKINFFVHSLAQAMSRGNSKSKPDTLSFVSETYTKQTDGKIRKVAVLDYEKSYTPTKVYLYKLMVTRENESISRNIVSSILTSTTAALGDNTHIESTSSSSFDMEEELAKIAESCLTPRDHEQLSGNLLRQGYVRIFNQHLISEAEEIIGLTEMRAALGFSPPGPWTKYREPSASELTSASTIEEYFNLKEPGSPDRSTDSYFFFEHNFPPVIAFLDKRYPSIRAIFKQKFKEILNHDLGGVIDRKTVDHLIEEYLKILLKVSRATDRMYRRSNECRRLSEMMAEKGMKLGPEP